MGSKKDTPSFYGSFRRFCLCTFLFEALFFIPLIAHASQANLGKFNSEDLAETNSIALKIKPEKSEIECDVGMLFMHLKMRVRAMEGQFEIIPTKIGWNSKGFVTIYPETIETINDEVEEKVKKTYLETEKFPKISFTLTKLEGGYPNLLLAQENQFKASGILKLHGIERRIVLCPRVFISTDFIEVKGETSLRIDDFGIRIPRFLFLKARNMVSIYFHVVMDYSPHLKNLLAKIIKRETSELNILKIVILQKKPFY